jgi:hypothetical protein
MSFRLPVQILFPALVLILGSNAVIAGEALPAEVRTETVYLSGRGIDDAVPWKFQVTKGMKANQPSSIPVPSCWELHGFGTYSYGRGEKVQSDEQGLYERDFDAPKAWQGKRVFLVFDGAMTDTEAKVNGQPAGPVHQGAFYQFKYDVTKLLKFGTVNKLNVTVSKESAAPGVNRAERRGDYWNYGGIFRPVYLRILPAQFIDRVAIDARADGSFALEAYLDGQGPADNIAAQILDADDKATGPLFQSKLETAKTTIKTQIARPRTWTAESPYLYTVRVMLRRGEQVLHVIDQRFGFRTIEVKAGDGIYVNGARVRLKGVNRHSFRPDSGRALSRRISEEDVELIKDMNMNAVRMSHYPPDAHFLDVCDERGLYVLDELAGWQKSYDTESGTRLVEAMVTHHVNHPSIVCWANGNEGGWNTELDSLFAKFDPQKRNVLHPWSLFGGTQTKHYPTFRVLNKLLAGADPVMPTEFLHGLYDGGHGAGLEDFWAAMRTSPKGVGGFLWVLADEGLKRTDQDDRLDTHGNNAPDGILGPHGEKEGSYFAIKDIWSPVQIVAPDLNAAFGGTLEVRNEYDHTDLSACTFAWELLGFHGPGDKDAGHTVLQKGTIAAPSVPPGGKGSLKAVLPATWKTADALKVSATDPHGRLLRTWTWPVASAAECAKKLIEPGTEAARGSAEGDTIKVKAGGTEWTFSATDGLLRKVSAKGKVSSLTHGPVLVAGPEQKGRKGVPPSTPRQVTHKSDGNDYVVRTEYDGPMKYVEWRVMGSGWARLEYAYELSGSFNYFGVGFTYPEEKVKSFKWLGGGPYRVWKNRLPGAGLDVWRKAYNDAITGQVWTYPEFKGYHANLFWGILETSETPLTIVAGQDGLYLHLFTPKQPGDARNARAEFPATPLSFLHAIAPIGTKFHKAADIGPASQKNKAQGPYKGVVFLRAGE